MTYEELLAEGRAMEPERIAAEAKSLLRDPRMAAVVAMIDQIKTGTADAACAPGHVNYEGSLAHAAGVRFGLILLEGRLKEAMAPRWKTGMQKPAEAGE